MARGGVSQRIAPQQKNAAPSTATAAGGAGLPRPADAAAAAADDGQLLCLLGASALGPTRQDATTTGCLRLDAFAASSRTADAALPDGCPFVVLDALCNASDASCARLRSDGTFAAKRADADCLRNTCSVRFCFFALRRRERQLGAL
jgi:hypothetical protein